MITLPSPTIRQLSGQWLDESWFLSVLAKRTYQVLPNGACVPAEEQMPLWEDLQPSAADPNMLEHDLDLIPYKPYADVIVKGHAYAGGYSSVGVRIRIGKLDKHILILGDRRCAMAATGGILFSSPAAFDKMPLDFAHAYGGRDRVAEAKHGNPYAAFGRYLEGTGLDADNQSPYLYPRNPCGKGYLIDITRDAVEQCALPNLEDPNDPLTPERLPVQQEDRWIHMPIPQALGWTHWGWFPRAAFGGFAQRFAPAAMERIPEIARGWMPPGILQPVTGPEKPQHVLRFTNGAPLDMQLDSMADEESVELTHVHPHVPTWRFRIPRRPRRMCIDGRKGNMIDVAPVLHTLQIEPDENRVTILWRGVGRAIRPYSPSELIRMPLVLEW